MELKWLGKYRKFIGELFRFANAYATTYNIEYKSDEPDSFSASQIQTVEYILENEDKKLNMAELAYGLGITPSAFSKNVRKLVEKGLLEKYHAANNNKEIIIRVSEHGKKVYENYSHVAYEMYLKILYNILDEIPDESVDKFTELLSVAATSLKKTSEPVLIKIE